MEFKENGINKFIQRGYERISINKTVNETAYYNGSEYIIKMGYFLTEMQEMHTFDECLHFLKNVEAEYSEWSSLEF